MKRPDITQFRWPHIAWLAYAVKPALEVFQVIIMFQVGQFAVNVQKMNAL
jgi:hypothetical protein